MVKSRRPLPLQLYHRWNCPYSARVREFIERQHLTPQIEFLELDEVEDAEEELIELTGRAQVPCLVAYGTPILESSDIITWLQKNVVGAHGETRI